MVHTLLPALKEVDAVTDFNYESRISRHCFHPTATPSVLVLETEIPTRSVTLKLAFLRKRFSSSIQRYEL